MGTFVVPTGYFFVNAILIPVLGATDPQDENRMNNIVPKKQSRRPPVEEIWTVVVLNSLSAGLTLDRLYPFRAPLPIRKATRFLDNVVL